MFLILNVCVKMESLVNFVSVSINIKQNQLLETSYFKISLSYSQILFVRQQIRITLQRINRPDDWERSQGDRRSTRLHLHLHPVRSQQLHVPQGLCQ